MKKIDELLQIDDVWENNNKTTLRYLVNKLLKKYKEQNEIINELLEINKGKYKRIL